MVKRKHKKQKRYIGTLIIILIIFAMLIGASYLVYQNWPRRPPDGIGMKFWDENWNEIITPIRRIPRIIEQSEFKWAEDTDWLVKNGVRYVTFTITITNTEDPAAEGVNNLSLSLTTISDTSSIPFFASLFDNVIAADPVNLVPGDYIQWETDAGEALDASLYEGTGTFDLLIGITGISPYKTKTYVNNTLLIQIDQDPFANYTVSIHPGFEEEPTCTAESDTTFCIRLNKECGSVTENDNCGDSRTANCGTCDTEYTCVSGQCSSSTPTQQVAHTTGNDGQGGVIASVWGSQSFTTTNSFDITDVKLNIKRTRLPGTCSISIRATSAGKPTGPDLSTGIFSGDSIPDTFVWMKFDMSPHTLQPSTQYSVITSCNGPDEGQQLSWYRDSTNGYAGGFTTYSFDSGTTWTYEMVDYDFVFEIWGVG